MKKSKFLTALLALAACGTPGKAKQLGRKVFLRPDWEEVKFQVMEDCLREKFRDTELLVQLIATKGHFLIEGTTWHDKCWGICTCEECGGNGDNNLGKLLMKIRDEYVALMDQATPKYCVK